MSDKGEREMGSDKWKQREQELEKAALKRIKSCIDDSRPIHDYIQFLWEKILSQEEDLDEQRRVVNLMHNRVRHYKLKYAWNEIALDGLPPLDMWCAWWDKSGHREPTVGCRASCDIELWWEGYTHWMELPCI